MTAKTAEQAYCRLLNLALAARPADEDQLINLLGVQARIGERLAQRFAQPVEGFAIPSWYSTTVTSKVPPPRSNTRKRRLCCSCRL